MTQRKQYPKELKKEVIATVRAGAATAAEVARTYKLKPQLVYSWVAAKKRKSKKKAAQKKQEPAPKTTHSTAKATAQGTNVVINGVSVTVRGRQVIISY